MDQVRAHLWISGHFFGEAYHRRLAQAADSLHVNGWLRRLVDGRLEAVLEGEHDAVEEAIRGSRRCGGGINVSSVVVRWEAYAGEQPGFTLRFG